MPLRYGTGGGITPPDNTWDYLVLPTDFYFTEFDGDWEIDGDGYYGELFNGLTGTREVEYDPEVSVGRLLCTRGAEVINWTKKLIEYEQNPGYGNNTYLSIALLTEEDEMQYEGLASDFKELIQPLYSNSNVDILSEYPGCYEANPTFPKGSDVINSINNNYGLISWFNHGSPDNISVATHEQNGCNSNNCSNYKVKANSSYNGYCDALDSNNGINNLSNSPSILYTLACETIPFDDYETDGYYNLGQAFTMLNLGGGPNYIGNTREGLMGVCWEIQQSFFNKILFDGIYKIGEVLSECKIEFGGEIYAVNYEGLIPIIIQAIKEQQVQIENLIEESEKEKELKSLNANNLESLNTNGATLGQNRPNPFNVNTEIDVYIPSEVISAMLNIYDLQGKQIKSITIGERQNVNVIIEGATLVPGIYYYSLITDGMEVGTKRMILTD